MDVREKARDLASALQNSAEYQRLINARKAIDEHQAAKIMLRDFRNKQLNLQKQQMEGKPITETQAEEMRKLYEIVSVNPYIRELIEAEFAFGGLMMEIQEIIGEALSIEEDNLEDEDDEPKIEQPSKKLWTPGN
ncbi:MAG: hypothetical protein GX020_03210 [Firmicutes bacterium]|nr:hypothetical protein [Bacillota bacterium]